jgi:signal transduction histidine kinase/streptogramin lyase
VGAIYEDDHGVLWIGTHSALHRIDRTAGKFQDFPLAAQGESTDAITMCEDPSGYLWVGTYDHGLFRFDPRTDHVKRFRHDPADPHSLSNDIVPRVFIDHNGTLWAATHDGLDRYDAARGRFTTYKVELQGVNPYYLGMAEDRRGILWLGTESSGLLRFDPATGQVTRYQHQSDNARTLTDNRVNSVYFDRSGTMWVGTQDGLNQFNESTGAFTSYSRREGLPGSVVACVLEDDDGDLWMSTDNGVAKFDPKTKKVKSYSTADGLPGPDLTGWGTCSRSKTGEMFFGGFSGATAFFPKNVSDSAYVPPLALTDFRIFGTAVLPGPRSPLKKTINYTDAITLSHEQNRFSVGFSALSYLNPTTNRYRYMLEGLDTQWNEVGSDERFATYTTLPVGTYTFRVEGATSRGPWSQPGATLRIKILPAWWNSWWFRSAYITALLLVGVAIYIFRRRQLMLEEERNERLRHAQADLAHMDRVSTMGELTASLAHEIKQPIAAAITDAKTCLRWLNREQPDTVEAQNAALRVIHDVNRASEIIGRVGLLFKKEVVQKELVDMNELVREMVDLLQSEAERHTISIHTDLEVGLPQTMVDRVGLQQVLMNLMVNGIEAIRDMGTGGVLTVKSRLDGQGALMISVSDTGVGIEAEQEQQIFNTFFTTKPKGTGMGLPISRSIVESHGGRLWVTRNEPRGAVFQFTIRTETSM